MIRNKKLAKVSLSLYICSREVKPETVGSKIEALVHHLHAHFHVKLIVVCQTINRTVCPRVTPGYNDRVALLNQYLRLVVDAIPYAKFWPHRGLREPNVPILCQDGVHLNKQGQYALYRSYRVAILYARKGILVQSPNNAAHPATPPP